MPDPQTLATAIKAKFPGQYDGWQDAALETAIKAKYPGQYDAWPTTDTAPTKEPNTVGNLASHIAAPLNPVSMVKSLLHPIETVKGLAQAHVDVKKKGDEEWAKGNYIDALAHYLNAAAPLVGPIVDKAAEHLSRGEYTAGFGDAIGTALSLAGPKVAKDMMGARRVPVATPPANAALDSAIAFGKREGIPIDAATATDNSFVRGAQHAAEKATLSGAVIGKRAAAKTSQALTATSERLAERAAPAAATAESAGEAVRGATTDLVKTLNTQASEAYTKLREIEASPDHAMKVHTAPVGSTAYKTILGKLAAGSESGGAPSVGELTVMRQIEAEMDAQPYTKFLLQETEKGGSFEHVKGTGGAGAPVYHALIDKVPEVGSMTRAEAQQGIKATLETGDWNSASRGALQVARDRLSRSGQLGGPRLPPGAPLLGSETTVQLPVSLKTTKAVLQPIYDRLKREAELVPLQGDKGRALVALDRLIQGPEVESASVVDAALGDLKAFARSDMPELRTQGQGAAAVAVKALDHAVQQAVGKAGPKAVEALQAGRQATVAKYQVAEILDKISEDPVKAFSRLVASKDTEIGHLRHVREVAPLEVPKVGRALLEGLFQKATAEGSFNHADKLWGDWQRIGPETKQILYGATLTQDLTNFFLLSKKLAVNPNPSGSAYVGGLLLHGANGWILHNPMAAGVTELTGATIATLAHSPKAMKALTNAARLSVPAVAKTVPPAVKASAYTALITAARESGVTLPVPAAAGSPPTPADTKSPPRIAK